MVANQFVRAEPTPRRLTTAGVGMSLGILALVVALVAGLGWIRTQSELSELQEAVESNEVATEDLSSSLGGTDSTVSDLDSRVSSIESDLGDTAFGVESTADRIDTLDDQVDALRDCAYAVYNRFFSCRAEYGRLP